MAKFFPHIVELSGGIDAVEVFRRLADLPHCIFLDSARPSADLGRFSFVVCDPFEVIDGRSSDPLSRLAQSLTNYANQPIAKSLPPFQGGAAGVWCYDLARYIERIPPNRYNEFQLPPLWVGLYDVVIAFDHQRGSAWLISQGFPEVDLTRRSVRAKQRADDFLALLRRPVPTPSPKAKAPALAEGSLAPLYPTRAGKLFSNFDEASYKQTVSRAINYIRAGDVFQVNLAQRLLCRSMTDPVSLYLRLRKCNPAPFAGYCDLGEHQIISASPERFLRLHDGLVEARPIKGTRQRSTIPEADLFVAEELKASSKDRAENVMIVDLMRNDLSRVCEDNSVVVRKLCGLEVYEFVQHLVSVVEGRLRDGLSAVDLIRATFPGGSITGAPKVRAMEIIAELEPTTRGAYCGALGYVGFDGGMDLNILIRTITASRGWWHFPVGGGIVSHSDPDDEYNETWHKAEGLLRAVLPTS